LVDQDAFVSERIAALNINLLKSDGSTIEFVEEEFQMDDIPLVSQCSLKLFAVRILFVYLINPKRTKLIGTYY
jgi:hypothetical protein